VSAEAFLTRDIDLVLAPVDSDVSLPDPDLHLARVSTEVELPGPHLARSALEIAAILHPEVFR
jgi:hypothetical protein